MTTMRTPSPLRSCWKRRPRSIVSRASNRWSALNSNSPFFVPDQPSACTVLTSVSRQLLGEGTRQIFVKQNAHRPEWSRGPNPEQRAPVSWKPRGTDPGTARSSHLLPGSRRATALELVCRGKPVCLRKSLDRCARPNVIRPACDHDMASTPPLCTSAGVFDPVDPPTAVVGSQRQTHTFVEVLVALD